MPIRRIYVPLFAGLILTAGGIARAQYLARPGTYSVTVDAELLLMPAGTFTDEIARLRPTDFKCPAQPAVPQDKTLSPFDASTQVDLQELGMALDDLKVGQERKADLISQYQAVRKEIGRRMAAPNRRPEFDIPYPVPEGIPQEFSDYLQALLWSHDGKVDDARILWEKIVALPADSRRYRGPWALFMLGRSYVESEPGRAIGYFQKAREWIGDGTDRLGLSVSSLGWEARALLNQGRDREAADLYLKQAWCAERTSIPSLQVVIKKLLQDPPEVRRDVIADAPLRRAITAYIFCNGGPQAALGDDDRKLLPGWLADLENHPVQDPDENDRCGWASYLIGDNIAAHRWINRGNPNSVLHQLLAAKLLLCGEKVDPAIPLLEAVYRSAPRPRPGLKEGGELAERMAPFTMTAATDLRALYLHAGRYTDALSLVSGMDNWVDEVDAAYIAEWLLTTDELRDFVDGLATRKPDQDTKAIRALLGRRLCRDGKFDVAKSYFDPEMGRTVAHYQELLVEGRDTDLPAAKRAASLFEAASMCENQGQGMFGLTRPDLLGDAAENRLKTPADGRVKLTGPSEDEIGRESRNRPADVRTDSYRHRAADLAWESAELSPDNSPEKLDALYTGGTWLKNIDPKAADRFYKAICRHCGETELGKRCSKAHWFAPKP